MSLAAVIGYPKDKLQAIVDSYRRQGMTVATAESLTGGLLAAVLTSIPGASTVFRGGVVPYSTDLKSSMCLVDEALLAERGPVDLDVAAALAAGAARVCHADIGIALTGVAGPDTQDGHPVGTVFLGRWQRAQVSAWPLPINTSGRDEIRAAAVRAALDTLYREQIPQTVR